jgi:hypothetical protein
VRLRFHVSRPMTLHSTSSGPNQEWCDIDSSFEGIHTWGYATPYCAHPALGPVPEDGFYGVYQEDDQGNGRITFDCTRTRGGITVTVTGALHVATQR